MLDYCDGLNYNSKVAKRIGIDLVFGNILLCTCLYKQNHLDMNFDKLYKPIKVSQFVQTQYHNEFT